LDIRPILECSGHRADSDAAGATVSSWPGPEILAIKLIAENQPFDSTWHEKFRCNRHGQLMADRVSRALRQEADVRRNHEFFNGRNVARTLLSTAGHNRPVESFFNSGH
jgi:4'-phosphopantetheinyl transferase EntD